LIGTWEGTGRGEFPTIDSFEYRELLEIIEPQAETLLHYRQQTWRATGDEEVASHAETGFISVTEDGDVELLNVQGTDRVEVLRGRPAAREPFTLELRSVVLAHDERMVRSWRNLHLQGDLLRYETAMATTAVPDGAPHLTARLTRM
jgi:hypothetical protein